MKTITATPPDTDEVDEISPEMLEVAQSYLKTNSILDTAEHLDLPTHVVAKYLETRTVRTFVDNVFMETGYRSRHKLGSALDSIIEAKLEEMSDAEMTSSKDITELLALAQKFRKDELDMQLKLMKMQIEATKVVQGSTINIQDNSIEGSNYGALLSKLIEN